MTKQLTEPQLKWLRNNVTLFSFMEQRGRILVEQRKKLDRITANG